MGTYEVVGPDGHKYEVEAGSIEEAPGVLKGHLQQEINQKAQTEYDAATWARPFMAIDDVARVAGDALTMGGLDKLIGGTAAMETEARKARMGSAAIPAEIAGGMLLPTGAPTAIAKVGGGPIVRGVTGMLAGGATGGAQGATSAYMHDQPVVEGAITGGAAGAAGQGVSGILGNTVNKVAKWWKGVDDSLPAASIKNVPPAPGKKTVAPSNPARRVEAAAARAEQAGGRPSDFVASFKGMNQGKLSPDILTDIRNITHGDLGTRAAKGVSRAAYGASLPGLVTGVHAGIPSLLASATAAPAVGYAANYAAGQGTKEGVEMLRRKLLNQPKFSGPISKEAQDKVSRLVRGILSED